MLPYDKYKNLDEFIEDIEVIGEIIFRYKDKEYSLDCHDGISIAESHKEDETTQEFATIDKFLNGFILDGKPIKDRVTELDIVFH